MFTHLFSLPVSFVCGLWLLLLKPQQAEEEPEQVTRDSGVSEELMGILSIAMRYLACVIPLITAFPLLFALQIVEDTWSWRSLVAFWLLPQLWILAQRSRCTDGKPDLSVFAYRDV